MTQMSGGFGHAQNQAPDSLANPIPDDTSADGVGAETNWLFPGLLPAEHRSARQTADVLRAAGVPVRAVRNTTWQHLAREIPPQILVDTLGIHPNTAMHHATQAGADWTSYAAHRSAATAQSAVPGSSK